MTIKLLSSEVVAQIAAGEVVERPANVTKELLENSLDAGASRIYIELHQGGLNQILVEDDGSGISAESLEMAFQRHATSKIQEVDHLSQITTLGFRGEALYSIAAVSHVTITSRTSESSSAHRLQLECGLKVGRTTLGRAPGTSVNVGNLFVNTPVRKRFLKSPAAEAGRVAKLVQRLAMSRPDVSFDYTHNGKSLMHTNGQGDVREFLYDLHGKELVQDLLPVTAKYENCRLSGFVSAPTHHFANRSQIECFVNGRWIQDRALVQAVVQGYRGRLPIGRFPFALISLTLDPEQIDVNVHPQKSEVRFTAPRQIFGMLQRAVERALLVQQGIPDAGLQGEALAATQITFPSLLSPEGQAELPLDAPLIDFSTGPHSRLNSGLSGQPLEGIGQLPALHIIGQVGSMYIVAESQTGMVLIDQHAAHERVLYEDWLHKARSGSEEMVAQQLLTALPLHTGQELAGRVAQNLKLLRQLGFEIEEFGSESFLVRAIPSFLTHRQPEALLGDLLHAFGEHRNLGVEELENQLVKVICKRAAIKAGQVLSFSEMEALLVGLGGCQAPLTCPHGRPTLIQFTSHSLEKAFGRT